MKPLALILAALCGFTIASAIKPRPSLRLETKAVAGQVPDMPHDNLFEVQSLIMACSNAKQMLAEQREQIRLWRARASSKAIALPKPEERKN